MRPLKLTMSAFGPYGAVEVIDFSLLKDKNIFLINGPTGAGKTTIFDGISYALFGKASSSERDGDNLRSDFADDEALTFVELEFELRGKNYYVKRIPKQRKKKLRGEGFTEQKADAEFKAEDGKLVSGVSDTDLEISKIMGISYEQFRQIVMIPQGEFRELILADSKSREGIFRKIFGTYEFENIQEKLDDMARNLRNEIKSLIDKREAYISKIECDDEAFLTELISADNINVQAVIDNTEKLLHSDKEQHKALKNDRDKLNSEHVQLQKKMFDAKETNKKFEEKDKIEKKKIELEELQDSYKLKAIHLKKGRKALKVKSSEDYYFNRKQNINIRQSELVKAQTQEKESEKILQQAKAGLKKETNRENDRIMLQNNIAYLQKDAVKIQEYEKKKKNIINLKKNTEYAGKQNAEVKKLIETLKIQKQKTFEKLNEAKRAAVEYVQADKRLNDKNIIYKTMKKLNDEFNNLNNIRDKWSLQHKLFNKADAEFKKAKYNYECKNDIYIKGQAGILAENLIDNMPCPVCGSIHHPNPAEMIEGMPSEDDIKKYKNVYEKLDKQNREALSRLTEINTQGEQQKNLLKDIKTELNEYYNKYKDEDKNKDKNEDKDEDKEKIDIVSLEKENLRNFLNEKLPQIENEIFVLKEKSAEIEAEKNMEQKLAQKLTALEKQIDENENKLSNLEKQYTELYGKYMSECDAVKQAEKEIPKDIHSYEELKRALNDNEKELERMKKLFDAAVETNRKAELNYNSCISNVKSRTEALKDAQDEFKKAEGDFKNNIVNEKFDNMDDYYNSKLADKELQELDDDIKKYGEMKKSINDSWKKAVESIKNLKIEDISIIEDEINQKQSQMDKLDTDLSRLFAKIKINSQMIKEITKINSSCGQKENTYKVVGHLAAVSKGDNSERISFERYVLASYFEDIIKAANIRFYKMTDGRYKLHRIEEKTKGRAQQGLDLEVYDNNTGKYRHVKTLSGGESFKASLSLALGLADVVQANAGGISLETMFIDEGFGTLDPESLDNAIQCLIELQKSGRLVGIISHVPELKERITARIEITPSLNGSTSKIII